MWASVEYIYEKARRVNPNGPRHEITHSNAIHKGKFVPLTSIFHKEMPPYLIHIIDDFPRLVSLRITAEMSPAVFHIADQFLQIGHTLRYELDEVHQAGGKVTIGTDWPVTETPNLLPALAGVVDRITFDPTGSIVQTGKSAKEVGGEIICRLVTLGATEALGKEQKLGSIEVGKMANFIAIDRDLSKGEFADAVVLKTWFEGRLVWDIDGTFRTSV